MLGTITIAIGYRLYSIIITLFMLICCLSLTVHWASVIGEYHHMGQWKSWEKPMVSRFQAMLRTVNLNYRIGTEHNTCLNMNNGWWTNMNQYWNEPIIIVPAYEHQPIWTNCTRSTQVMGWSIYLLRVLGTTWICFPDRKTKRMGKLWVRNAETIWKQHLDIWWGFNYSGIQQQWHKAKPVWVEWLLEWHLETIIHMQWLSASWGKPLAHRLSTM